MKIINQSKNILPAISMIVIMILSTQLLILTTVSDKEPTEKLPNSETQLRTPFEQITQLPGSPQGTGEIRHPTNPPHQESIFQDIFYNDPAAIYGKVSDISALSIDPRYGVKVEESTTDDHDNDGINDLEDLDDDNDGINDLIERFDGCYGTDPFDHDNDGILDEDDWDDDNDGILEGPVDWTVGNDPKNNTKDRQVISTTIHPWTGLEVGPGYVVDQNPFDHDNDGVTDEDIDGPGRLSFDEDDDNDGRIDQFVWPCDFDSDGLQDYFDEDDDNDGLMDLFDAHPWDDENSDDIRTSGVLWDGWIEWEHRNYSDYVDGLDYVALEAIQHPRNQSFTTIYDGDLDGDGIPNFLDPDNDNDGAADSSDTDDDNDGLADMYDVDDDNDGIPDTCLQTDTNNDQQGDYPILIVVFETPGIDCEIDYDGDLDDDRFRPIDQDYDLVWDWLDPDLGGTPNPDNPTSSESIPWDLDNDGIKNELDSYPLNTSAEVVTWDCPSIQNPNPVNPSPNCSIWRTSYSGFNDWDGDGINNWDDVDDDGDGILDWLDIDEDCDLDNDAYLHELNGSKYRDDGTNDIDTDVDGDGLPNDEDWDDDNDGITDFYDPDDGNCGFLDNDNTDLFEGSVYPQSDGEAIDGTFDGQIYSNPVANNYYWNLTWGFNPFNEENNFVLDYNGYDDSTIPFENGQIPEFYWYVIMKWSPYNGINFFDIDTDGDSLVNGVDVDQDADGLPDWWDQDEGNDGVLDINDVKMGGSFDDNSCGTTLLFAIFGQLIERACGLQYAWLYGYPLMTPTQTSGNIFTVPYSTRPDSQYSDGEYDGSNHPTDQYSCDSNCFHFTFDPQSNPAPSIAIPYTTSYTGDDTDNWRYAQMKDNRDLWIAYVGLSLGLFNWNADLNGNFFPDEIADALRNFEDPDVDCSQPMPDPNGGIFTPQCMYNNTNDLDDDWDIVYDHFDIDDDNDGVWDYFEVDTNDDLDDDSNTEEPFYFTGTNCEDNDDDGLDTDPDGDGWYQAVWDKGVLGQSLLFPEYYDVDNDNDGVPDGEDPDDDNNGVPDVTQEGYAQCFVGEEQSPWDHDNDGIVNWMDDDWDADGIPNSLELQFAVPYVSAWDHDNDGLRDDIDLDDDSDGMKDEDEVMLWPSRFNRESTNPWDHDDFGNGSGIYNPSDNTTGPDVMDVDDDGDGFPDLDWNNPSIGFEPNAENKIEDPSSPNIPPCQLGTTVSLDWDSDNDCTLDEDDKPATRIFFTTKPTLWLDYNFPAMFNGTVFILDMNTSSYIPGENLPVQVHIEYTRNNTSAIETIDVLTDENGRYTVGQYLFPEDLSVGPNTTYQAYAEVTEMFYHDYSKSEVFPVEVKANTTIGFVSGERFRSDEQPLKLDFKVHYTADYDRGIYDRRIPFAPVTFTVSGGAFGNITHPTTFDHYGLGFRADKGGWVSLTFEQDIGIQGDWKQVRWNSTLDNGPGIPLGGYEEILWSRCGPGVTGFHQVIASPHEYTNTSLPIGDYSFIGFSNPELGKCSDDSYEWPWPHLEGDETDSFSIRSMQRMYVEAELFTSSFRPVYFWDSTQFTGSSFGAWRALFHSPSLSNAGLIFEEVSIGKPYPILWDGTPAGLESIANGKLTPFISSDGHNWAISMQNGADFDSPPCGAVDPSDPNSDVRCEIIPEMFTGEKLWVNGTVSNRTFDPWDSDYTSLQIDKDRNGQFVGRLETAWGQNPDIIDGEARFSFNWTWTSQYSAGTFGLKADFVNTNFYFTGNQTSVLASTGAYANVTVIGTTEFDIQMIPTLYRGQNASIEVRLEDNAGLPIKEVPVQWNWSANSSNGIAITDNNGIFKINLTIGPNHDLGNFTIGFSYLGDSLRQGSSDEIYLWVVSRTFIWVDYENTTSGPVSNNQEWRLTGSLTQDDSTPFEKDNDGIALNGCSVENGQNNSLGGNLTIIFEGIDFEDRTHRQIIDNICPNSGVIFSSKILDSQLLRHDPYSFLPDGFGPVNVILRFEENLPHEGCEPLNPELLSTSGGWDECVLIPNSDHFRKVLQFQVDGFYIQGESKLQVDNQVVYTSEIDEDTGLIIDKPMIVTGQLTDEMDVNLSSRKIRVTYQMGQYVQSTNSNTGLAQTQWVPNDNSKIQACIPGITDSNGFFDIVCPMTGIEAGVAKVTTDFNSYENNDRYRYKNKSVDNYFDVFSNSTIEISEIGPFKSDYITYTFPNETTYQVLYLKESYHINAKLMQTNGKPLGNKCLNIYLDPEQNTRPVAKIEPTEDGTGIIDWYSADIEDNPSRRGVEPSGNKLEGFRTIRVAYEPDVNKKDLGGCENEPNPVVNSTFEDVEVLVRSKVKILLRDHWANPSGYLQGDLIEGEVAIQRERLDLTVEGQRVDFTIQYWDGFEWKTDRVDIVTTNERGAANFSFQYPGDVVPGQASEIEAVDGKWRVLVHFQSSDANSPYFVEEFLNSTPVIFLGEEIVETRASFFTTQVLVISGIAGASLLFAAAIMYRNYLERRRIEVLRGILTDSLMSLKASNNFVETIFESYKNLIKYFRSKGAMKKVFETTREFEDVIHSMLGEVIPPEELNSFFSIFEEARYSDHEIGPNQQDRAIRVFQTMITRMNSALGDSMLSRTSANESKLYDNPTKAGQFIDSHGQVRFAGVDDSIEDENFRL